MNPEDMKQGYYYWRGKELFLCRKWISKESNGYGNALLKRIYPKQQVSGSWFCFKHWQDKSFREHSP